MKFTITHHLKNGKNFENDSVSFNLSEETSRVVFDELMQQAKKHSPYILDRIRGSFSVSITDKNGKVIYDAVNL